MDFSTDWIFPKDFIENPRGDNADGSKTAKDKDTRSRSIWFMEDLSLLLNIDRRVLCSASVFFHRFYLFHSFAKQNRFHVAVACLFLAGKVEEKALKLKDLVHGYFAVRWRHGKPTEEMLKEMNKNVILSERLVLQALNFDLVVVHPLNYLMIKMRELKAYTDEMSKKNLLQTAVNFLNDSYRGTFCLEYTPSEIGAAVLFLATITLSLRPLSPARSHVEVSWIQLLEKDIREYRLRSICLEIMDMYEDLALIMPGLDADGKKEMRQQITAQVITQLGNTFPSHLSLKSMSSQDDSLHDGTTNQTTPALHYGQDDHAFELDTPRETGRKTLDYEEASHGQTGRNHNISYGASEDDTHGGRRPNVTVTKIVNSSSSSVQYQHNQQTMSATASSSTMFTNVVMNGALLTPSSISGMERGETSTMSFAAQSEDANSYIEETPVYYNMPLDDGPTDTPTFSDLATKVRPNSRQRSRSNSLSDYASFGMDFKRTRAE